MAVWTLRKIIGGALIEGYGYGLEKHVKKIHGDKEGRTTTCIEKASDKL